VFCRYYRSLQPMPMPASSGGVALALFVSKELIVPKVRIENRL
jgi:exosome complex exonuclease DIS3/RRP44